MTEKSNPPILTFIITKGSTTSDSLRSQGMKKIVVTSELGSVEIFLPGELTGKEAAIVADISRMLDNTYGDIAEAAIGIPNVGTFPTIGLT